MTKKHSKIEVITSESEHWYESKRKKGLYYPSVTTILSVYPKGVGFNKYLTAQSSWESSQQILQDAGRRGTRVHEATQFLEEGTELLRDSYTMEEWEMLMGFVGWWQLRRPERIHVELPIISEKLKTGGTIDRVYKLDGKTTIVDIKTSSTIHANYWVQVATYAEMYELETKEKVDEVAILRVTDRKKDRYEFKTLNRAEWKEEFKTFKHLQEIWKHLNPSAGPKILEIPLTLKL